MVEPRTMKWIAGGMVKRIYFHPDGTPTNPLPCDSYSLKHYLGKGFTLEPPQCRIVEETPISKASFVCEHCNKSFGARIALIGHQRSHRIGLLHKEGNTADNQSANTETRQSPSNNRRAKVGRKKSTKGASRKDK